MTYLDGSTVQMGDRVWWDEENAIGRIVDIHENTEQCASSGTEEAGVFVCYDGSETGGLFVGYPHRAFAEEGIRRLTSNEENEVDNIIQKARELSSESSAGATAGLFRSRLSGQERWNVVFYRDRQAVQVIEVDPYSFSCREIPLKESGLFYDLK